MHIPDGFINAGTSAGAAVIAAGGVSVAVKKTSHYMEDKQVPLAGLTAAFVFAVQMLNFPVAAGTSGHLLGGALAAILVGPFTGVLCIAVVLLMQGVLFADGALLAPAVYVPEVGLAVVAPAPPLPGVVTWGPPIPRRSITGASFVAAL